MGTVAAVAAAIAGLISAVMYILKRHDSPEEREKRRDAELRADFEAVDEALGESDADTVTRVFSELDDRVERVGLRLKDRAGAR